MASLFVSFITMVIIMSHWSSAVHEELKEPLCSKYAFEERLLERSVRTDHSVLMMEKKLVEWEARFEETLKRLQAQEEKLNQMQMATVSKTDAIITSIEEKTGNVVEDLQNQIARMSGDLQEDRRNMNETLQGFLNNTTIKMEKAKDELVIPAVSFYAREVDDNSPSIGSLIRFVNTRVNVGDSYNSRNGYFTAPQDGVYMFTVQICTYYDKAIEIQVITGGAVVAGLTQYDKFYNPTCASLVAITTLKAGDQAWVKCSFRSSSGYLIYSGDSYTSSFSGVLLNRGTP